MAQTLAEYVTNSPASTIELCGCGCGKQLQKNDPLGPFWVGKEKNRELINEDCYFERMGEEIDKYPIGGPGLHGPKNKGPID